MLYSLLEITIDKRIRGKIILLHQACGRTETRSLCVLVHISLNAIQPCLYAIEV